METVLNTGQYKQRLLAKEKELLTQINRAAVSAREPGDETARDAGDESVANEQKEQQFREIEADRTVLGQVREALRRIDNGTFGKCLVDGETIEAKRLDVMPWTPYCLKHQQVLEGAGPLRMPTL